MRASTVFQVSPTWGRLDVILTGRLLARGTFSASQSALIQAQVRWKLELLLLLVRT
jgi:hypothetical protein